MNIYFSQTDGTLKNGFEQTYLLQLPATEQQRYQHLHPKRQIEWLTARALLSLALEQHYDIKNGLRHLRRHPDGGVYVMNNAVSISISHSQNTVAIALGGKQLNMGLDIEAIRPRALIQHTEKIFTCAETAWLNAHAADQKMQKFYWLWTLKEAIIKARRGSIWHGLQGVKFSLDRTSFDISSPDPGYQGPWQLWSGELPVASQLALAVQNPPWQAMTIDYWNSDLSTHSLTPWHQTLSAYRINISSTQAA